MAARSKVSRPSRNLEALRSPARGLLPLRIGALALALLAVGAACGSREDHFRRAQELIAAIERDNVGGNPDYTDRRYDDVLVELSSVPANDPSFWKAREWTQKITDARAKAPVAKEEAPVARAARGRGLPAELTSPDLKKPGPPEATDPLEWHENAGGADVRLLNFTLRRDATGVFGRAWLENTSGRGMRIKVRMIALSAEGSELSSSESYTAGREVADRDRADVSLVIGAYDPSAVTEAPPEPAAAGSEGPGPMMTPFDPAQAARFRLEFMTVEGSPLSWADDRVNRVRPPA